MFLNESEQIWLMWRVLQTRPREHYLSEWQHYPNCYKNFFLYSISSQYTICSLKVHELLPSVLCKSKVQNLHRERRQVMLIAELHYNGECFLTQQLPERAGQPLNDYQWFKLPPFKSKYEILSFKILNCLWSRWKL